MDDDDFAEIKQNAGEGAMAIIDALGQAEVQEALEAWSGTTFDMIRALERSGLSRTLIAGMLGGGVVETLNKMNEEDAG